MSELLACTDLHKSFTLGSGEPVDVLLGLDLAVAPGELVAITGASGVGKSTLLHVLGALEPPDRGRLLFKGDDVYARGEAGLAAFRNRSLGFIFQFHHLLPEFSALENVMMPALIDGRPRAEARQAAGALLEAVDLGHRLNQRPGKLSGGEQQRVAIARALVMAPDLVLADEPTGNLDEETGEQVLALLDKLTRQVGKNLIMVTHSKENAIYADRIFELQGGCLVEVNK